MKRDVMTAPSFPDFWINVNWLWQEPKPLMEAMRAP